MAVDLKAEGIGWVSEATFLARMDEKTRAWFRKRVRLLETEAGREIVGPSDESPGLHILVLGQATVTREVVAGAGEGDARREEVLRDLRPGRVIGAWTRRRYPFPVCVRAGTDCRTLHLADGDVQEACRKFPAFGAYVEAQVQLMDRWDAFQDLAARNRFLRVLGRDETGRLIESGKVVGLSRGQVLLDAGKPVTRVFLIVRGRAAVQTRGGDGHRMVVERGSLIGEVPALLDRPADARVVALDRGEVLSFPAAAFRECVSRNPVVQWQILNAMAAGEVAVPAHVRKPAGSLVCVLGCDRRVGETTVAYGLAECLRTPSPYEADLDVTLVDLQGADTARRLRSSSSRGEVDGVAVRSLPLRDGFALRVVWPERTEDARPLLRALVGSGGGGPHRVVVLSGVRRGEAGADALEEPAVVVTVRAAGEPMPLGTLRHEHFRVQAVRIRPGRPQPLATSRKAVRLPDDLRGVARFWETGRLSDLASPATPLGRAFERLARVVRGSSVGLALGGGGAFGFAHVGLIRALHEAGVPVDFVAGVSFGSLVGAVYVGGGLEALGRLVRDGPLLKDMALTKAPCSTRVIGDYVDEVTGGLTLGETEVPFYPVGLDLVDGREFVLAEGTLGLAVRSASSMPGLWPALCWKGHRVVDGGVVNNVPVSTLWDAGADFLLASNCLPSNPMIGQSPSERAVESFAPWLKRWIPGYERVLQSAFGGVTGRVDDGIHALYNVFSQNGRDRSQMADHVFEVPGVNFDAYAFDRGAVIADAAYKTVMDRGGEEISAILDSYRQDLSRRF